ncbi:putative glucose transporter rco-3 [Venturia inaequalis]|nr:putative glucose transporter rco-3 [Venturia inaequalis]
MSPPSAKRARTNTRRSSKSDGMAKADAGHNPNIIELILQDDKLKFEFPRPPCSGIKSTTLSHAESSDSDVEPLFLDDDASATWQDSSEDTSTPPAEDQRHGIPIPRHGMSGRRPSTWESEMDDERVLEQLAASEGGFNRSWQESQQGR